MTEYKDLVLDEERALYGVQDARVMNCTFAGPADGESALKETRRITVENCRFELRYPLWHCSDSMLKTSTMTDSCRAALWYDRNLDISACSLGGIKALRECHDIHLSGCQIDSPEFGWYCRNVEIKNTRLVSEYPFMHCRGLEIDGLNMKGKYSFQYTENVLIKNSVLDTKDAFWHAKNITVQDSIVQGEYLGWYSENLTFIRCKISGTQPLCYCKDLVLKYCEMQNTDLSFEYSDVRADVRGAIESVKNPLSGYIQADTVGQVILDENLKPGSDCRIEAACPDK